LATAWPQLTTWDFCNSIGTTRTKANAAQCPQLVKADVRPKWADSRFVAFLFNPATATYAEIYLNPFKAAAASFAVEAITAPVYDTSELETVIAAQARAPNSGLITMPDSFLNARRAEVTSLAARHRLPAVYPYRLFAEVGGLLSYGNDVLDNYRRAAIYADRILKGEKVADLPVQAPTKYELVINLKTARALGLEIPGTLLARAPMR